MAIPPAAQQFLRDFARAFAAEVRRLFSWRFAIEIVASQPDRLILRSAGREIVVDRTRRNIMSGGRLLAPLASIQSVVISQFTDDGEPRWWTVILVTDRIGELTIGKTSDESEASIVAARLATLCDKPVLTRGRSW